jgi:hypothetical protein
LTGRPLLAAETTAHVMSDHADLGKRQPQCFGHVLLDPVNALGGFPDRQAVSVPGGHAAVQFHGSVDFALGPVVFFEHDIGLGKPLGNITAFIRTGRSDPVALLVDGCGPLLQGCALIDYGGQDLIGDIDGPHRIPGQVGCLCGGGGHGLALEPAVGIEELGLDLDSRAGIGPRDVRRRGLSADHGVHAGHAFGLGDVDFLDPGMGMRAAQDGRVEHVGQRHIRRIDRRAAHPLVGVHPGDGLADDPGALPGCRGFTGPGSLRDRKPLGIVKLLLLVRHDAPPFEPLSWAARPTAL